MAGIFDDMITYVRVDTTALPPLVIPKPLAPAAPGGDTSATLRYLKPRVEIGIAGGAPIVLQKWGDPRPGKWSDYLTYGGLGLGLLVAFAGYGLYTAVRGRGRAKPVSGLASLHARRRRRR